MGSRDIAKIDKTILENFYKLVHTQENVRLTAACSTFKILDAFKKTKPEKFNENLNYCLDRLIAGLASSRACARRGYGCLLMQLLSSYPISTDRLFTIAKQKFSLISNETTKDNLLGYYVLIKIILQTKNYERTKSNPKFLEVIYQHTTRLQKIKAYFDYPTSELLTENYELFHPLMLADIPQHAFSSDSKISHNELLLIILCDKKEPIKNLRIMDNHPFSQFFSIFENDRLLKRPIHPLWVEFSKFMMAQRPQQFETFCKDVLLSTFFKANHNQLASIGLEIISKLVNFIGKHDMIHTLLPDHVMRTVIVSSLTKSSSLRAESLRFLNDLQQYKPMVLEAYMMRMVALINTKPNVPFSTLIQKFAAKQIGKTIRRPQLLENHSLRQKVIKYLILSSLFKPRQDNNKDYNEFWQSHKIQPPRSNYEQSVRQLLRSSLHDSLYIVTRFYKPIDRLEYLDELIEFSNSVLQMGCVEYVGTTVGSGESAARIQDQWSNYMAALNKHRQIIMKEQEPKRLSVISTLYLFYGLQILEHQLDCSEQLEELAQSTQEVLKGDPRDSSWADLLTDQIIAILSATECAPWIKKLCVSIFGSLLPHTSETSVELIRSAMSDPTSMEDDEGEDDDDHHRAPKKGELAERQNGVAKVGKKVDKCGDKEDPDDQGDQVRDEDEEEEEYLDDEQMMKLDSVIGEMFKLKRKRRDPPSNPVRCLMKKVIQNKRFREGSEVGSVV